MKDKIAEYLMDRTVIEEPIFCLGKILKQCDMSLYEKMCKQRIISEVGVDNKEILMNFVDNQLYLTHKGIEKCEAILQSFCNTDQMMRLLEYTRVQEEYVESINEMLDFFRKEPTNKLKELAKELKNAEEHQELRNRILTEIRSRSVWNRARVIFRRGVTGKQNVEVLKRYREMETCR